MNRRRRDRRRASQAPLRRRKTAALVLQRHGARITGQLCALAGYGIAVGATWFGSDLVYDQQIGVTHAAIDAPESFATVAHSRDVPDNSMRRVRHDDLDLLLVWQHRRVGALAHSWTHMSSPLSEGTLEVR